MSRRLIVLAVLFTGALAAFQWTNQKKDKGRDPNSRNVIGVVQLPDDSPASGAVVQLKNMKSLQVKSYITQADGKYQFQNLSTKVDYELVADYKEFGSPTRKLTMFDTRLDAVINLKLESKGGEKK